MQFAKPGAREKVKFASRLTAHGDELREAALAGCGIVRLLACHVEDELRTGALVQVLPDWEFSAVYLSLRATEQRNRGGLRSMLLLAICCGRLSTLATLHRPRT